MVTRTCLTLAATVLLAACTAAPPRATVPAAAAPAAAARAPAPTERADVGRAVYHSTCARCHETGEQGAPVAGRPADWARRSRLWQAVLADHVQRGWLAMPARGGNAALSDAEVQAAADYLLARAHRREPQD